MSATGLSAKRQHMKTPRPTKLQIQLKNMYSCIAAEKCSRQATLRYALLENPVDVSVPPHTSYHTQIKLITAAASVPIAIESLSPDLSEQGESPRGNTAFGQAADYIDMVASNCGLRWWVTEHGLVMAHLEPSSYLSEFDKIAGKLTQQSFREGRLKIGHLEIIAKKLDEHGFSLKECVRPSYWKQIAEHNQHYPANAIKSFVDAIGHNRLGRRAVQKALYVAREKFLKSHAEL
jgi:hypothetical protein